MQKIAIVIVVVGILSAGLLSGCTNNGVTNSVVNKPSTPTETESQYKASCSDSINIDSLISNPESFKGRRAAYIGTIDQVIAGSGQTAYRIDVGGNDDIYVTTEQNGNYVQNDAIQMWGEITGSYSYDSIANYRITIPSMWVFYMQKADLELNNGETLRWIGYEISVTYEKSVESYSYKSSYGDYVYTQTATTGDKYVFIIVSASNIFSKKISVPCPYSMQLIAEGKQYSYEGYLGDQGYQDNCGEIYPGVNAEGKVVFQVPENVKNAKISVELESYPDVSASWTMAIN